MTQRANILNLLLLVVLAMFWGSAFSFIKIAVGPVPPLTLAAGRILVAAVVLGLAALASGERLPGSARGWGTAFIVGLTAAALPFSLIAWGEQYVGSGTTSIAMALIPLWTLIMAHFLTPDEKLSARKLMGVVIGFSGIVLMFGGGISGTGSERATAAEGLLAVLAAVISYALSGIFARNFRNKPRLASSAAVMIAASAITLPLALAVDRPWTLSPTPAALGCIAYLGLVPTALATLLLITLAVRAGATFLSLANYLVPLVGLFMGVTWLGETLSWQTAAAFAVICLGIYVTGFTASGLKTTRR